PVREAAPQGYATQLKSEPYTHRLVCVVLISGCPVSGQCSPTTQEHPTCRVTTCRALLCPTLSCLPKRRFVRPRRMPRTWRSTCSIGADRTISTVPSKRGTTPASRGDAGRPKSNARQQPVRLALSDLFQRFVTTSGPPSCSADRFPCAYA